MNTSVQTIILYRIRQIETAAQIIREVHDVRVAAEVAAWMEEKAQSLAEFVEEPKFGSLVPGIEVLP
jgi:hypothetical protein